MLTSSLLVPSEGGTIKNNQATLIAKEVLESGKLLIITSGIKPLNDTAIISFLQRLGLDRVTLDNIKSAIYERNIVREDSRVSNVCEHLYVFALSITNDKFPSISILSADCGAKVTLTTVSNFIINTISKFSSELSGGR